jgi:basic amino acid/polyamine antiporter, APA family
MRKVSTKFSKDLGLFDSVLLGIGFIIGSGIFLFPILMASQAGTFSMISWVVAGVYSILTGLCFAENAQKMPRAGGLYAYAHASLGNVAGFLTGWAFWTGYWMTLATEIVAASLYLRFFLPALADFYRMAIATAIALALTAINFRGVRSGGRTEDILTIGKLGPLAVFIIVGAFLVSYSNYYPLAPPNVSLLPAVGSATVFALWAYLGVEIITVPEEEMRDAKHTVPRAIIISVFTVMSIYLLVAAVTLGLGRWEDFVRSQAPLADIFQVATQRYFGNAGGTLLALGGLVAILGSINAVILGAARISYAMARDGLFPQIINHLHPKFKTPDHAIMIQTILAISLVYALSDFTILASLAVLFTIVPYLFSCLATIKLISKAEWKTHVLHTRWIAFAAVAFSVALFFYVDLKVLVIGMVFMLGGLFLYYVSIHGRTTFPASTRPLTNPGS